MSKGPCPQPPASEGGAWRPDPGLPETPGSWGLWPAAPEPWGTQARTPDRHWLWPGAWDAAGNQTRPLGGDGHRLGPCSRPPCSAGRCRAAWSPQRPPVFQATLPAPSRPRQPPDTVKPQPPGQNAAYWAGHPSPTPDQSSPGRASPGPVQTTHLPGLATEGRWGVPRPTDTARRAVSTVAQQPRWWACCRLPPLPAAGPPQGLLPAAALRGQSRTAPVGPAIPTRQQGPLPSGWTSAACTHCVSRGDPCPRPR